MMRWSRRVRGVGWCLPLQGGDVDEPAPGDAGYPVVAGPVGAAGLPILGLELNDIHHRIIAVDRATENW
jgi:hypothetical protein